MQIRKCVVAGFSFFFPLPQIKNISPSSWFKFLYGFILHSKAFDTSWEKKNKTGKETLVPFNKANK